ncbi:MAG TPA: class III extradiol ring-cleavage dioxygenase [Ottowia sp.]|uniref:DODA-type extradiol aromatic ring-opening family dioxygenase n=1 Tax=Ottowia sp. TaxID=1898956 RepID=UPI002CE9E8FE|nr:class III extradiol ring-cleavage dioxygenase [Ottowia sp.]HMN20004.1 class III extradiol ring-cleavage dioxygenase [Ottowia sp.]
MSTASARMPTLYIPHGAGPCFFMNWDPPTAWERTAAYLRGIPASLPAPPTAIVLVSAHWLAARPALTTSAQPGLLFDYYGFPPHTYELRYPAPGAPALAERAADLLAGAGFAPQRDARRGFDHGVFVPLKVAFPDAGVPVLQLSLLESLDAADHLRLGRALEPLRDEGVLIIGSGMSYHNMRGYGDPRSLPASEAFDRWLVETVSRPEVERNARLADWAQASAPAGRLAHPARAEEHLLPLHVAAGAAGASPGRRDFSDRVMEVAISAFRFG